VPDKEATTFYFASVSSILFFQLSKRQYQQFEGMNDFFEEKKLKEAYRRVRESRAGLFDRPTYRSTLKVVKFV
jgi:hypothetical protein